MQAKPHPAASGIHSEPISYLDGDAPIVLSISPGQLPNLYAFAHRAAPQEAPAIELAAFALTAILGFNPTNLKAWTAQGFDLNAPIVMQVAAPPASGKTSGQKLQLWRTRLVFKPLDRRKAIRSLQSVKLRARAILTKDTKGSQIVRLANVLQLDEKTTKRVLPSLQRTGIFLIGLPTPLDGFIVASTQGDFIVLDLLHASSSAIDWNKPEHRKQILSAVRRHPMELNYSMAGADSLRPGRIGLWIRPIQAARLLRAGNHSKRRALACAEVASLVSQSSFRGVSAELSLHYERSQTKTQNEYFNADMYWHFDPKASWVSALTTTTTPLLSGRNSLFGLDLFIDKIVRFRDPNQSKDAWLPLWIATQRCGPSSKALATLTAWPQILSSLLHEISALHPKAEIFLQGHGAASLSIGRTPASKMPTIVAETWIRSPGDAVAREWLSALFGKQHGSEPMRKWGSGPIEPFAKAGKGGSTIGAGFSPGSRAYALKTKRQVSPMDKNLLLRLRARPAELERAFPQRSAALGSLSASWQELNAQLSHQGRRLHLRFRAR